MNAAMYAIIDTAIKGNMSTPIPIWITNNTLKSNDKTLTF